MKLNFTLFLLFLVNLIMKESAFTKYRQEFVRKRWDCIPSFLLHRPPLTPCPKDILLASKGQLKKLRQKCGL